MIRQTEFSLPRFPRGFHLITREVLLLVAPLPQEGLLHLFIKHTSAALAINENVDPAVLVDFESFFNYIVPEHQHFLTHTAEGADDMPAHIKSVLAGASITVPVTGGKLNLGIWQGIYLCEFRNYGGQRTLVATIYS